MTTPPTPAGWYPDPEHAGQLRYWDGGTWTDHRSPIQEPAAGTHRAADEQSQPQTPAPEAAQPDAQPEPVPEQPTIDQPTADQPTSEMPTTEHPTTEVPLRPWSFEPPPLEPETSPVQPESMSTYEPAHDSPPVPLTEQPTTKVPLPAWTGEPAPESGPARTPEPAPYADATTSTPPEPPAVEPPAGTEPREPVDNRKLVLGFGGAVAALLVLLALAAAYAFVIHKPDTQQLSSPRTQTSTITTQSPAPSGAATPPGTQAAPPAAGAGATDGPLTFAVTSVESGSTVSDPTNEFLSKNAQGEFIVVHLTVQNTSPDPGQFVGTFQKLKAGGQVYSIDDEATFYVGGGFVDVPPGGQVDVGLAYDVPPGTAPETIELHADPTSPGVELPVQ